MKFTFCSFIGLIFSLALALPAQGQNVSDDPMLYVDSAYTLAMSGHLQEAVALNHEALEAVPEDSASTRCEFYSCLLYCFHRLGDYEQALRYGEMCLLYDEQHGTKADPWSSQFSPGPDTENCARKNTQNSTVFMDSLHLFQQN